ncbi:MAG: nucleotidyltransferase family protein [Proteobacteria bacterium]|nr:nucleotidyltransferase family protein [Pseudomonadota bacterium]
MSWARSLRVLVGRIAAVHAARILAASAGHRPDRSFRAQRFGPATTAVELSALAKLVRDLCRVAFDSGRVVGRPAALPGDSSASHCLRALPDSLVRSHMLGPLAYSAGIARFRDDFVASSLLAELREKTVSRVIAAMAREDVPVILLKGISYATTLYSDPAERPMSDVDLLVPPDRHRNAARILRRLGYWVAGSNQQSSPFHHAIGFKRKNSSIDLHRSIMQSWRSRIDIGDLWRRARPARERDDGSLRLDPVDEAVIHLAHMARHELRVPLVNYVDAVRILARLPASPARSRELVVQRARAFRLGRAVSAALDMTDALSHGVSIRPRIMPTSDEILAHSPVPRPLQIARKALLVEGPTELIGFTLIEGYGRIAHRFRR